MKIEMFENYNSQKEKLINKIKSNYENNTKYVSLSDYDKVILLVDKIFEKYSNIEIIQPKFIIDNKVYECKKIALFSISKECSSEELETYDIFFKENCVEKSLKNLQKICDYNDDIYINNLYIQRSVESFSTGSHLTYQVIFNFYNKKVI